MIISKSNKFFVAVSLLLAALSVPVVSAFAPCYTRTTTRTATQKLKALTERQQQFWEDVETGLNDIESFYKNQKGQDIDRIRLFGKR